MSKILNTEGKVIAKGASLSMKELVEKNKLKLEYANLRGAELILEELILEWLILKELILEELIFKELIL
jgi:hypothetical protein